jgi:hypothetical protein
LPDPICVLPSHRMNILSFGMFPAASCIHIFCITFFRAPAFSNPHAPFQFIQHAKREKKHGVSKICTICAFN